MKLYEFQAKELFAQGGIRARVLRVSPLPLTSKRVLDALAKA